MALKDNNKSFANVAKDFNISSQTVINIFEAKVDIPRQHLTTVLCVDVVYARHKYCFITYSPQLDNILDVLPSRIF